LSIAVFRSGGPRQTELEASAAAHAVAAASRAALISQEEPMNREQAQELLEKLRRRTEERGATPAEAAQAAELAEKIIQRYHLDTQTNQTSEAETTFGENRMPRWAHILCWAIQRRMHCEGGYWNQVRRPVVIVFRGEEHRTRVAAWLFKAIAGDLEKRSRSAAEKLGFRGSQSVRYRNRFKVGAAWELYRRMVPMPPKPPENASTRAESPEKPSRRRRAPRPMSAAQFAEFMYYQDGAEAGREISISTDVMSGGEVLCMEHAE
jgi:hypothetical protein